MRAGVDFMSNCTMSGAHQMDLRMECDWSDPYVTRGGTVRVVRRAFQDRTRGNVPGVHFYDEPGLTWINGTPARRPQPGTLLHRRLRQGANRFQESRSQKSRTRQGVASLGEVEAQFHGCGLEGGAIRRQYGAGPITYR